MAPLLSSRHHRERVAAARRQVQIALEVGTVEPHPNTARLIDAERLRGLPAVGRGIGGAIRGTTPGSNL